MRKNTWLAVLLWPILFSACALGELVQTPVPTETPEPKLSATSRRLYEKLVEEGTLLQQMTENGVNFRDFSQQFAKYESVHTMIFEVINNALDRELVLAMDKVVAGWGGAQTLWDFKVKGLKPPTDGDERFLFIQGYVTEDPIVYSVGKYKYYFDELEYDGPERYIEHGDAISSVLSTASGHFKKVRTELLKVLATQGE